MKKEGIVKEYNGFNGKIIDNCGKDYLLLKEEIINNEVINKLDTVTFVPEKCNLYNNYKEVARFVKKKEIKK